MMLTATEVEAFLSVHYPQLHIGGQVLFVEEVNSKGGVMRFDADHRHLRPGGTVSGPNMMMLADVAMYAALLGHYGPVGLAVTTSFSINFLRKPPQEALRAVCRFLKKGKQLVVLEADIVPAFDENALPVAHAVATYSLPPQR